MEYDRDNRDGKTRQSRQDFKRQYQIGVSSPLRGSGSSARTNKKQAAASSLMNRKNFAWRFQL